MSKLSIDKILRKAKAYEKKGDRPEAIKSYKSIIKVFPANKKALSGLKRLSNQASNLDAKQSENEEINNLLDLYNKKQLEDVFQKGNTLTLKYPKNFSILNILGAAAAQLGKLEEAENALRNVTRLKPNYAAGFNNLGNVLHEQNKNSQALAVFKKAIEIKPDYAEAYNNLGVLLHDTGEFSDAVSAYENAIKYNINYAEAFNNKGKTLRKMNLIDLSLKAFEKAIDINPDFLLAMINKGCILHQLGESQQALSYFESIRKIDPNLPTLNFHIANVFVDKQRNQKAIEFFRAEIKINPNFPEAYNNLGILLKNSGKLREAVCEFENAISYNRHYAGAYHNLGLCLLQQGALSDAIMAFRSASLLDTTYAQSKALLIHCMQQVCDWKDLEESEALSATLGIETLAVSPFALLSLKDDPQHQLARAVKYTNENLSIKQPKKLNDKIKRNKKIKIAYASGYFTRNPVSILACRMLELHDRENFEVYIYYYGGQRKDEYLRRIEESADYFVDVSNLSPQFIASDMRCQNIDIAIDFHGHMEGSKNELFEFHPAHKKINFFAFPGTTGSHAMDYLIADKVVIPESSKIYYTEKIIYLPSCYMPQDNTRKISNDSITRADFGLPEDAFVFCCFNKNYKITPKEFDIWMRLLKKKNGSVLWLLKSNVWSEKNLKYEAKKRGVSPDKIIFAEKIPIEQHLQRLKFANLFLDTFNFNAHTTASDALWAGVPLITKLGSSFAARVGASLVTSLNLPELITYSETEYEQLAVKLANDSVRLKDVTEKLKRNLLTSPLFDTENFTKNLEQVYLSIMEKEIL
ncbi:tetratricopeptide repeat protein [Rhodobacteraceae bacterium]|nr:tetratricopeptide repeat protein [Paracoccaceae bacterium]